MADAEIKAVDSTRILINLDFKEAISIWANGTIEFHSEFEPDEAAKVFWAAIEAHHPYRDEIEELRKRLAYYEPVEEDPGDPIAAYNRAMKVVGRP